MSQDSVLSTQASGLRARSIKHTCVSRTNINAAADSALCAFLVLPLHPSSIYIFARVRTVMLRVLRDSRNCFLSSNIWGTSTVPFSIASASGAARAQAISGCRLKRFAIDTVTVPVEKRLSVPYADFVRCVMCPKCSSEFGSNFIRSIPAL